MLDGEMRRLVRLGLDGRIRIQASLVRRRWLSREQRPAIPPPDIVVSYAAAAGKLLLDGVRELPDDGAFRLHGLSLRFQEPIAAGREYSLEMHVRLQVVTASSLTGMAGWLTGERGTQAGGALSRSVVAALVNDLVRSARATCPLEPAGDGRP